MQEASKSILHSKSGRRYIYTHYNAVVAIVAIVVFRVEFMAVLLVGWLS